MVCQSVCRFVCLSLTTVSPEKAAEQILMLIKIVQDVDQCGPKGQCIRWGLDPHTQMGNSEDKTGPGHVQHSTYSKQLSRSSSNVMQMSTGVNQLG